MKRTALTAGIAALAGSLVTLAIVNEDVEVITHEHTTYVTTVEPKPGAYEKTVEVLVPVEVTKLVEVEVIKEVEVEVETLVPTPSEVFDPWTNELTTDAQGVIDSAYAQLEEIPACVNEDGSGGGPLPCFWSATTRGNGQGQSFFVDETSATHYVG